MDFFAAQDHARAASRRLVWLFAAAALAVVAGITGAVAWACTWAAGNGHWHGTPAEIRTIAAWTAGITAGAILLGAWLKWLELRAGGAVVAEMLGGTRIRGDEGEGERRLVNVVEEMAIASGVPVPQVFVLRGEGAINAFAAGHTPADAAVAVTRGSLDQLNREQLQGVVAHEFSHLLNGDMALNLRLMAMLHGIHGISLAGAQLIRLAGRTSGRRSGKKGDPAAILIGLGALLWLVGSLGHLAGQLIRAAVSRTREFLADASAAQFTRNPRALAEALTVVANHGGGLAHARAGEAAHLLFARGLAAGWFSWFATHPPIDERVRRLGGELVARPASRTASAPATASVAGPASAGVAAAAIAGLVGRVDPAQVAFGRAFVHDLPTALRTACIAPVSARAVALALVMEADPVRRQHQRDCCERFTDVSLRRDLRQLQPLVDALPAGAHLPLANLAMPALRQLLPARKAELRDQLRQCVAAVVPRAGLSVLGRLRRFDVHLRPARPAPAVRSLDQVLPDCALLLSALADAAGDEAAARRSFAVAVGTLLGPGRALAFVPHEQLGGQVLGQALDHLQALRFADRRILITACAWAVAEDGQVNAQEGEWLQLAADALGCPLPPFAPGVRQPDADF